MTEKVPNRCRSEPGIGIITRMAILLDLIRGSEKEVIVFNTHVDEAVGDVY